MKEGYAGIDFGTTNLKLAVFLPNGELSDCYRIPTPAAAPAPVGYNPEEIWEAFIRLLRLADEKYRLHSIAITGMAEAGIMLDRQSKAPLTGIIPWSDRCTAALEDHWRGQAEAGFLSTGLRNSYKYGAYKYMWALECTGQQAKDTCWLSACDYLAFRLTGERFTDPTFAARTYVYNLFTGDWDKERLDMFGLSRDGFPSIVPSGVPGGLLRPGILKNSRYIPVAVCGHDHLCSAFGLMDEECGGVVNSMGTAEIFLGLDTMQRFSPREATSGLTYGVFVRPELRYWMANIPSAGRCVDWAIGILLPGAGYEGFGRILEQGFAAESCPLFFPFLNGSGTPDYDTSRRAAYVGLSAETSAGDMVNAVVNGLCFQERFLLELSGVPAEVPVLVSGGAAACAPWMQRKADLLKRDLLCRTQTEGTLFGAVALLCSKNGDTFVRSAGNVVHYAPQAEPAAASEDTYKRYLDHLTVKKPRKEANI